MPGLKRFRSRGVRALVLMTSLCCSRVLATAAPSDAPPDLPREVTIRQLLQVARDQSPRYASLRTRIEIAEAEVVAAGVLPNPSIKYERWDLSTQRNTMFEGRLQEQVTMEIPLLIAGQRGARVEAAERQVEAAQAATEAEIAGVNFELWTLYLKLLAEQQRVEALEEARGQLARLKNIVSGREQAGNASPYDVLRMDVELKGVETRIDEARSEVENTAGRIGEALGFAGWKPRVVGTFGTLGVTTDVNKLWRHAEQMNPELDAARRSEIAAGADVERASRERWPVPALLVGTTWTAKPYGNTPYSGLAVDIPLFDYGQGGMARAEAQKRAAILERQLTAARTRKELERAAALLERRRRTLDQFASEVISQIPKLHRMAEDAYRLGKGSLLDLLDATRSRTAARINYLDLLEAETEAEIEVLKASGLLADRAERAG
ncbi:MAG: TolC family protein [Methylotetracoccus sp.]|nr:TolC family protein [Methylotetracoccus sp.]